MKSYTVLVRYGLAYVAFTTDRSYSGYPAYLVFCDGSCFDTGSNLSAEDMENGVFVGEINSNGTLAYTENGNTTNFCYVDTTEEYVAGKNYRVVVIDENDGNAVVD